jgi:hypothetical protein
MPESGEAVICMRVESDRQIDCGGAGTGWLHRLVERSWLELPTRRVRRPKKPKPKSYMPSQADVWRRWRDETAPVDLKYLADHLGVWDSSLDRLGFAWASAHQAWGIPMRSIDGKLIGLRLRSERGGKWALPGSRAGLFLPDTRVPEDLDRLIIVEGPTDVAALLDAGVYAIGRSSCTGNVRDLVDLGRSRDVVILADRDEPKQRPDGTTWRPGQFGAEQLAEAMAGKTNTTKIIYPLAGKDARQWKPSRQTLEAVINNTSIYWPKRSD